MTTRRSILAAMGLAPVLAATGAGAHSAFFAPTGTLREAAERRGRYFGAALRPEFLSDERLRRAVLGDCGSLTPEIHLKWDALRPTPDQWTTQPVEELLDFAARHDLTVRGHALLWPQSTPAWAARDIGRQGWSVIEAHFDGVFARFGDRIHDWDVVNEPVGDDGGLRPNLFHRAVGPDYVERALRAARERSATARLVVNDYGLEYDNPVEARRREGLLALVRDLRRQGAPLDAVGLQAHLDLSKGPLKAEILKPFLRRLADEGVEILITELDVKEAALDGGAAARDQRVSDAVDRYLELALAEPAVKGVTTWGLSDRHSWLQSDGAADLNRGLPYDAALNPKPMRDAIQARLAA